MLIPGVTNSSFLGLGQSNKTFWRGLSLFWSASALLSSPGEQLQTHTSPIWPSLSSANRKDTPFHSQGLFWSGPQPCTEESIRLRGNSIDFPLNAAVFGDGGQHERGWGSGRQQFWLQQVQRNGIPAHCQWASILEAMAVAGRRGVVWGNEWGNLLCHFQLCDLGHTM